MPRGYLCTEVTPQCPVEATTLGYYPNLGANVFFCLVFGLCTIATFGIGMWKRTWAFGTVVAAGFGLETAGYVGRILMHHNPWSSDGFKLQIVCIVLGPTLICAGIYLTLKHVALTVAPTISRLRPHLYTWIFIPSDVFCLILQAVGGTVDAIADNNSKAVNLNELRMGNDIIIAGIALQVVVLSCFGLLSLDFFYHARLHFRNPETDSSTHAAQVWVSKRFRIFCTAVTCAYGGILIRCIYRIAEMSGGWGNPIMRNQVLFIVLEGAMILYPAILLSIFAPGLWFPEMGSVKHKYASDSALSEDKGATTTTATGTAGNTTGLQIERDAEAGVASTDHLAGGAAGFSTATSSVGEREKN